MAWADWVPLASTAGVSAAGGWLLRHKSRAEARKAEAESGLLNWERFDKEITRLDTEITALRDQNGRQGAEITRQATEIFGLNRDREQRKRVADRLGKENVALKERVKELEDRLNLMGNLFSRLRVEPDLPDDIKALLDQLKNVPGVRGIGEVT